MSNARSFYGKNKTKQNKNVNLIGKGNLYLTENR